MIVCTAAGASGRILTPRRLLSIPMLSQVDKTALSPPFSWCSTSLLHTERDRSQRKLKMVIRHDDPLACVVRHTIQHCWGNREQQEKEDLVHVRIARVGQWPGMADTCVGLGRCKPVATISPFLGQHSVLQNGRNVVRLRAMEGVPERCD
jgi:hypothetical protein